MNTPRPARPGEGLASKVWIFLPWALVVCLCMALLLPMQQRPCAPMQRPGEWCPYGSLPGYWTAAMSNIPGTRWRVLDPKCQLINMLLLWDASRQQQVADVQAHTQDVPQARQQQLPEAQAGTLISGVRREANDIMDDPTLGEVVLSQGASPSPSVTRTTTTARTTHAEPQAAGPPAQPQLQPFQLPQSLADARTPLLPAVTATQAGGSVDGAAGAVRAVSSRATGDAATPAESANAGAAAQAGANQGAAAVGAQSSAAAGQGVAPGVSAGQAGVVNAPQAADEEEEEEEVNDDGQEEEGASHTTDHEDDDDDDSLGPGLMFLSDSVDKHILTHLCELAGGQVVLMNADGSAYGPMPRSPAEAAAQAATAAAAAARAGAGGAAGGGAVAGTGKGGHLPAGRRFLQDGGVGQGTSGAAAAAGGGVSGGGAAPSPAGAAGSIMNSAVTVGGATRYLAHTCELPAPQGGGRRQQLRLLATYIPGVHPTGPFHKGVKSGWRQQLEEAVRVWNAAPSLRGHPPDVIVVASALWDLARIAAHEPHYLYTAELPPALLSAWVANMTAVVRGVRRAVPQALLVATHTTMPPKFNVSTGLMDRGNLGRRFFITQLNAAARQVARQEGLELVDYASMASRFFEGQAYLGDGLHPGRGVALELANVWLNLAVQARTAHAKRGEEGKAWCHPSMPCAAHHHHRRRQLLLE